MTPEQMIALFRQQAERTSRGLEAARKAANYQLAALNVRQGFKAHLMEGLITWKTNLAAPLQPMARAVQTVGDGVHVLRSLDASASVEADAPVARASILAYLLNETPLARIAEEVRSDVWLDQLLACALQGDWDETAWNEALDQLRSTPHSDLAVETYHNYQKLLRSRDGTAEELARLGSDLFARRASDAFFSGGEPTEGGGLDNRVSVDYRLAAILKKIGYEGDSMHRWHWG